MAKTDEHATPKDIEKMKAALKESNEDRKRDKLRRQIVRAHEWRIQVWAQSELKMRGALAELEVLGGEIPNLLDPDFGDDEALHHYASMTLSK